MHYYAICAIVKDEALYLPEWLEFNLLQGAEHFYIYDNDSTDNTKEVLKPYIKEGLIHLSSFPGPRPQLPAYQDCLNRYGKNNQWLAFLDADEFLYGLKNQVKAILPIYAAHPALAVRWYFYGSSGRLTKKKGLVIERFFDRQANLDKHVKSIVQPSRTLRVGKNPHAFYLDAPAVTETFEPLPEQYAILDTPGSADIIRINHYHTKSREEYEIRKKRPCVSSGTSYDGRVDEMFKCHDVNEISDVSAVLFASKIKENLLAKGFSV